MAIQGRESGDTGAPDDLDFSPKIPNDLEFNRTPAEGKAPEPNASIKEVPITPETNFEDIASQLQTLDAWKQGLVKQVTPTTLGDALNEAASGIGNSVKNLFTFNPSMPTDPKQFPKEISEAMGRTLDKTVRALAPETKMPTEEEIRRDIPPEFQEQVLRDLKQQKIAQTSVSNAREEATYALTAPFMLPQKLIFGNTIRAAHPELMQRVREENERRGASDVIKFMDNIAPPLYLGSDVIRPKIQDYLKNYNPEQGDILEQLAPIAGAVAALGVDTITDPLFYLSFGGRAGKLSKEGILTEEGVGELGTKFDKGKTVVEIPSPGDRKIFVDERGTFHIMDPNSVPTKGAPKKGIVTVGLGPAKYTFDAPEIRKWGEQVLLDAEMSRPGQFVSGFATNTSNKTFNESRNVWRNEIGAADLFSDDVANASKAILGDRKLDEGVSKYATLYVENPRGADTIASRMGINLSKDDKLKAQKLGDTMVQWRNWANDVTEQSTGKRISQFAKADVEHQIKVLSDPAVRTFFDSIPEELRPYMFSENANLARRVDPGVLDIARAAGKGEMELDAQLNANKGFKEVADAMKQRNKLSTWAVDEMQKRKYGLKPGQSFYDWNVVRSTQNDVRDILSTSANKRFANTVSSMGKTAEEWDRTIKAAQEQVQTLGRAVDPETYRISRLQPGMLKELDTHAFDEVKRLTSKDLAVDLKEMGKLRDNLRAQYKIVDDPAVSAILEDNINHLNNVIESKGKKYSPYGYLENKRILFEPTVRGAVNAQFSPGHKIPAVAAASYINSLISKAYLSSIGRVVPQLYEATTAAMAAGPSFVAEVPNVIKSRFKPDLASDLYKASGLEQNLSNAYDAYKGTTVTPKLIQDPTINTAWSNTMAKYRAMVETKQFEKTMIENMNDGMKVAGQGLKAVANKTVDNWLGRTTRDMVNGFENIPKEALYRRRLKMGDTPFEAADYVGRSMLDFRFTGGNVKKYVSPTMMFGNYFVKSMERLPFLVAKNPWMVGFSDTDRGTVKRVIEGTYWKPTQLQHLQEIQGPFPPDPVFGGFLPGPEYVGKQLKTAQMWTNNFIYGLLGQADKISPNSATEGMLQKSKEGFQVMHYLPSFTSGPRDFLFSPFSERGAAANAQPLIRSAVLALSGMDLSTGEVIPLGKGKDFETKWSKRFSAILETNNPLKNPNFWNLYDVGEKIMFEKHAPRINGFLDSPETAAILSLVGKPNNKPKDIIEKLKIDESRLKSLISMSTLGLIRPTVPDFQFQLHRSAMMKERKDLIDGLMKAGIRKDKDEFNNLYGKVINVNKQIEQAIDWKLAYDAGTLAMRRNPDVAAELLGKEDKLLVPSFEDPENVRNIEPEDLPKPDDIEQPPQDLEFKEKGEPGASNQQNSGRSPASGFGIEFPERRGEGVPYSASIRNGKLNLQESPGYGEAIKHMMPKDAAQFLYQKYLDEQLHGREPRATVLNRKAGGPRSPEEIERILNQYQQQQSPVQTLPTYGPINEEELNSRMEENQRRQTSPDYGEGERKAMENIINNRLHNIKYPKGNLNRRIAGGKNK